MNNNSIIDNGGINIAGKRTFSKSFMFLLLGALLGFAFGLAMKNIIVGLILAVALGFTLYIIINNATAKKEKEDAEVGFIFALSIMVGVYEKNNCAVIDIVCKEIDKKYGKNCPLYINMNAVKNGILNGYGLGHLFSDFAKCFDIAVINSFAEKCIVLDDDRIDITLSQIANVIIENYGKQRKADKKKKYVPSIPLTGVGEDYNVYVMNSKEKLVAFVIGTAAGTAAMLIMFYYPVVAILLGIVVGLIAIPVYKSILFNKRTKKLTIQFKDMLDSLATAYAAGETATSAFTMVKKELASSYGDDAIIVKELSIIINGYASGYKIEDLLDDFAKRSGIEDIKSFVDIFNATSGDGKARIVKSIRDTISDKISVDLEVKNIIASAKLELTLMCFAPFLLALVLGTEQPDALTIVVRVIACVIFAVAYLVGAKITKIRV